MPEIALKIAEVNEQQAILKSANPSLDFELRGAMTPVDANKTEVQLLFEGKFNPFIKMMVEKPLKSFLETLTDNIEKL